MVWNFKLFKRGYKHTWDSWQGDAERVVEHVCDYPPRELWEEGDEIQCLVCGRARRFIEGEWRLIEELWDRNEPSC